MEHPKNTLAINSLYPFPPPIHHYHPRSPIHSPLYPFRDSKHYEFYQVHKHHSTLIFLVDGPVIRIDYSNLDIFSRVDWAAFEAARDSKKFTTISDSYNFTLSTVLSAIDFTVCISKDDRDLTLLSLDYLFVY